MSILGVSLTMICRHCAGNVTKKQTESAGLLIGNGLLGMVAAATGKRNGAQWSLETIPATGLMMPLKSLLNG